MKKLLGLGLLIGLLSTTAMAATGDVKLKLRVIDTVQVTGGLLNFGTFIKNNNQGALTASTDIKISNIDQKEKGRLQASIEKTVKLTGKNGIVAKADLKLAAFDPKKVVNGEETLKLNSVIKTPEKLATGSYMGSATVTVVYN